MSRGRKTLEKTPETKHLGLIAYLKCSGIVPIGQRVDTDNSRVIWYQYLEEDAERIKKLSNGFFNKLDDSIVKAGDFYEALQTTKAQLKQQRF